MENNLKASCVSLCIYLFTAISFSGGKFVWGDSLKEDSQPWKKYLIPNRKTERMSFFNSITEEVYESAFTAKQSQFKAYLDGQRQFRWGIKLEVEDGTKKLDAYKTGMIPKHNISCTRYREFPKDVKVQDVEKCRRVVAHVSATLGDTRGIGERLTNRKKELYSPELKLKPWASSELKFINEQLSSVETMIQDLQPLYNDTFHVLCQLEKRFPVADILQCEKKRKARRAMEHKAKMKKQKNIKEIQNTASVDSDSDSDVMVLDILE